MDEVENIFGVKLDAVERVEDAPLPKGDDVAPVVPADIGETPTTTPMTELAHYVMARFRENSDFRDRSGVSKKLNDCILAQTCRFSTNQRDQLIRSGFHADVVDKVFVPITSTKIRAAKSMLIDLANQSGDPLFRIEATPLPEVPSEVAEEATADVAGDVMQLFTAIEKSGVKELPPDMMAKIQKLIVTATRNQYDNIANAKESYARVRAKRMEKKVWDIMLQGGWNKAFEEYLDYICTYGTGVMIGPIIRVKPMNKCIESKESGVRKYRRVLKAIPCYEAVNPQDCYPAPDALDVEDGALCIRVRYTADELWRYSDSCAEKEEKKNGEGWNDATLRGILARHPNGGVKLYEKQFDPTRRFCENNGTEDTADCTFEGVRCFASIRGSVLAEMGIVKNRNGKRIELNGFYRVEAIVIDNYVVYCRIYDDVLGVPLAKGTFYPVPGSWWGESIADKVAMTQCTLNNVIKALLQNMSAASGAIIWVNDVQRLADKSPDALKMRAGKTVPFLQSMIGNTGAPIGAISIPSNASELLAVWKQMQTQADLDSGIPAFTEGQTTGGNASMRTASGLAIYTEASTRGMKMVMTTTDKNVISTIVRKTADYILLYDDDMDLKGDVEVKPVGLIGKILKAQRDQQRLQLFNMVAANQMLQQLVGVRGMVALFRPSITDVDINPDDVIPSEDKLKEMELINGIKQLFEATSASNGVQQNAAAEAAGAQSGVAQPPKVQGGVAERRGVA